MFTIQVLKEDILKDYPIVFKEWMDIIKNNFKKEINEDDLEFYYSYGFNISRPISNSFEKYSNMNFDERLKYEISRVRVNMSIKINNFFISDRMEKGTVPKLLEDIIKEVTKIKMLIESDYHNNKEIKDSIPDLDKSLVSFSILKEDELYEISDDFDVDSILDKISERGLESLSDEEKEFLNRKSKDI